MLIDASITRRGLQKRPALIDGALTEHSSKPGHDIVGTVTTVTIFFLFFFCCPSCGAVKEKLPGFSQDCNFAE